MWWTLANFILEFLIIPLCTPKNWLIWVVCNSISVFLIVQVYNRSCESIGEGQLFLASQLMENRLIHNTSECNLSLSNHSILLINFFYSCLDEESIWSGFVVNDIYIEDWFWYRKIDFNPWFICKWNDCMISAWHSLVKHLKLSYCSGVWSLFYF